MALSLIRQRCEQKQIQIQTSDGEKQYKQHLSFWNTLQFRPQEANSGRTLTLDSDRGLAGRCAVLVGCDGAVFGSITHNTPGETDTCDFIKNLNILQKNIELVRVEE